MTFRCGEPLGGRVLYGEQRARVVPGGRSAVRLGGVGAHLIDLQTAAKVRRGCVCVFVCPCERTDKAVWEG